MGNDLHVSTHEERKGGNFIDVSDHNQVFAGDKLAKDEEEEIALLRLDLFLISNEKNASSLGRERFTVLMIKNADLNFLRSRQFNRNCFS